MGAEYPPALGREGDAWTFGLKRSLCHLAAATETLEGRWCLQPLASTGHCVGGGLQGAMGTGRAARPGGLRRLQAQARLMGECQGSGGDRISAASSCPKPLLLFSRGTQLPSLCRARAVGDPKEIGGRSQQGSGGLLSSPCRHTPVHDHLRFGGWFGKTSELLSTAPQVSVEPPAFKVLS